MGAAKQAVHLPKAKTAVIRPDTSPIKFPKPIVEVPGLDKAVRNLFARNVLEPDVFYSLGKAARDASFTISADLTNSTRDKIKTILTANTATTTDYSQFVKDVREEFDDLPISDRHLQQVFRNNVNESYSQGTEHVLDHSLVGNAFPFRAYYAIHDERCRPEHEALETLGLNGTNIYLATDPTWIRFRPPWSWNCRCGWSPVSIEGAADEGVKMAIEWRRRIEAAENDGTYSGNEMDYMPAAQFVKSPPFAPDPRWERIEV